MSQEKETRFKEQCGRYISAVILGAVSWLPERFQDTGLTIIGLALLALCGFTTIVLVEKFIIPGFFWLLLATLPART
jgi:hypothetical protein